MEIKSNAILKLLSKYYSNELTYRLDEYSHDEDSQKDLEQMGELEYIKREIDWCIEDFEGGGHVCHDELQDALELKKTSNNFKVFDIDPFAKDFKDRLKKQEQKYKYAKNLIQEYKNLKKLQKEINKL